MACVDAVKKKSPGPQPWTLDHNICCVTAWWAVTSNPLGRGTGQKMEVFWGDVFTEFNRLCAEKSVAEGPPIGSPHVYRQRTPRGVGVRFGKMQLLINSFIEDYGRARFVVRASGATEVDFIKDAHK